VSRWRRRRRRRRRVSKDRRRRKAEIFVYVQMETIRNPFMLAPVRLPARKRRGGGGEDREGHVKPLTRLQLTNTESR